MPFRLHIDFPLDDNEDLASKDAQIIIDAIITKLKQEKESLTNDFNERVKVVNYRLSNDNDRRLRNYLVKDENNHAIEKKTSVEL